MKYYVYQHINPHTKKVFYVGSANGNSNRAWDTSQRNEHWQKEVEAIGGFEKVIVEIVYEAKDTTDARVNEYKLIQRLHDKGEAYCSHEDFRGKNNGMFESGKRGIHPKGMLGKKHSLEFKYKLSKRMKQNNHCHKGFWSENNRQHPRGMKGKSHDQKTREQICQTLKDKKVNCKKVKVILPNGEEHIFEKKQDAADFLGLCSTGKAFLNLCKTGLPYEIKVINQHTKKNQHLVGTRIITLKDNTEVTNLGKTN